MNRRSSLSLKIALLAFLNVALLAAVLFTFARVQFRLDLGSFLFAPARDRMLSVSRLLALQLPEVPSNDWGKLLASYAATYKVDLYLFDSHAVELAGPSVVLPAEVQTFIHEDAFAHHPPGRPGENPPRSGSRQAHPDHGPVGPRLLVAKAGTPPLYWACIPGPLWVRQRPEPLHVNVVWRFHSFWTNPFFFDYRPWLAGILALVLVSVACWLPFIRGLTRTVGQMTRATGQIAEGHFEIALSTRRRDELGQLSHSINSMAHRLSDLIGGQRRFLSDIAHELTSPVARMQFALGILETRAEGKTAEYVADIGEELDHMSTLINELLSFSKASLRPDQSPLASVNLADVAARVLDREASAEAQIETAIDPSINVLAHPECLYRSLANLVRNAVRYAASGGPILLSARTGKDTVTVSVADNGPGLPPDELENVFKPFYRPEFARQRETGGTGLGLAIVKSCVEASGGSVLCRNRIPRGLEVEIVLASAGSRPA